MNVLVEQKERAGFTVVLNAAIGEIGSSIDWTLHDAKKPKTYPQFRPMYTTESPFL
jgi:hypothetical protein